MTDNTVTDVLKTMQVAALSMVMNEPTLHAGSSRALTVTKCQEMICRGDCLPSLTLYCERGLLELISEQEEISSGVLQRPSAKPFEDFLLMWGKGRNVCLVV